MKIAAQQRGLGNPEMGAGKVGVERQRALGAMDRLGELQAVVVENAEIVIAVRVARGEPDRAVAGGQRVVVAAEAAVDLADVAMIERRVGRGGDRAFHQPRRLVDPALPEGDDAQQMERPRVLRRQCQGLAERLLCLVQPAGLLMPLGEADELAEAVGRRRRYRGRRRDLRARPLFAGAGIVETGRKGGHWRPSRRHSRGAGSAGARIGITGSSSFR